MKNEGIRGMLEGFYRFLGQPLFLWSRPVLVVLVVPLALALTLPLWRIELAAPQYPSGLSVDIYAHTITSGHEDKDLREINILNHYIGMKKIERSAFAELDWIPFGLGALAILVLRVAAVGDVRALLDLAVMAGYFTAFSGGRFAYKMYVYGHDLSPEAPVKVEPFMPALLGTKQIGNFTTHAWPGPGTYVLGAFVLGVVALALIHLIEGRRRANRQRATAPGAPV